MKTPSARPPELEVADLVAVLADDLADQARAGVVALTRRLGEQELARAADRADRARTTQGDVEAGRGELAERLALLVGQPEQVADDQERDREREGRDEVDGLGVLRGCGDLVDLPVDDAPGCRRAAAPAGAS